MEQKGNSAPGQRVVYVKMSVRFSLGKLNYSKYRRVELDGSVRG